MNKDNNIFVCEIQLQVTNTMTQDVDSKFIHGA